MTVGGAGTSSMVTAPAGQSADQTVIAEKAMCYCVTAHRPSAVLDSVVCNLTGPEDTNLIISKVTRLEIHKVVDGGTVGLADVPIYGRIDVIKVRLLLLLMMCASLLWSSLCLVVPLLAVICCAANVIRAVSPAAKCYRTRSIFAWLLS